MSRMIRNACLLIVGVMMMALLGFANKSEAGVSINIGLPEIRFPAPPEVVVIPGTYVYMVPDSEADILFYQGYWWRPNEGHWYRSANYDRGWSRMSNDRVPSGLRGLPQDYRHRVSAGSERISHKDVQKNWKQWEKTKHWDKQDQHKGHDDNNGRQDGHGNQGR